MTKTIVRKEDLSFDGATDSISTAQKFAFPVPKDEGVLLVNEDGSAITDWRGNPKFEEGAKGVIFYNPKDQTRQGALTDGTAIFMINEVEREDVKAILAKIAEYADDARNLTLDEAKEVLAFIKSISYEDQYESDLTYWDNSLEPVLPGDVNSDANGDVIPGFGFVKRKARDLCQVIYVPGSGEYVDGPSVDAQKFENGAVLVQHDGKVRLVQADIFLRTYSKPDGTKFADLSELTAFATAS